MRNLNIGGIYTNPFGSIYIILEKTYMVYYLFLIDSEKEKIERTNEKINDYLSTRIEYDQRFDLIRTDILPFLGSIAMDGVITESIDGYLGSEYSHECVLCSKLFMFFIKLLDIIIQQFFESIILINSFVFIFCKTYFIIIFRIFQHFTKK